MRSATQKMALCFVATCTQGGFGGKDSTKQREGRSCSPPCHPPRRNGVAFRRGGRENPRMELVQYEKYPCVRAFWSNKILASNGLQAGPPARWWSRRHRTGIRQSHGLQRSYDRYSKVTVCLSLDENLSLELLSGTFDFVHSGIVHPRQS